MLCLFIIVCTYFISFKYDFQVDVERMTAKNSPFQLNLMYLSNFNDIISEKNKAHASACIPRF